MHTSPFASFEPVLLEVAQSATFEEYDSEDSLHYCEDERPLSSSTEFEPLPAGPEYVVLNHDRESTSSFHNKSLEMENKWAMEFREAPTLKSNEKDSPNEHGNFTLEMRQKPCSFTVTPESCTLGASCTNEDYNHLIVLFCKIFRRLVVDVFVYRKHCRFCGCTMALTL